MPLRGLTAAVGAFALEIFECVQFVKAEISKQFVVLLTRLVELLTDSAVIDFYNQARVVNSYHTEISERFSEGSRRRFPMSCSSETLNSKLPNSGT